MAEEVKKVEVVEPTPTTTTVEQPKKKKTNIAGIILVIVLSLCAVFSFLIYKAIKFTKNVADNAIEKTVEYKEEYEEIQKEIREVTQKGMNGELSQEEVNAKLKELNKRATELLKNSNED